MNQVIRCGLLAMLLVSGIATAEEARELTWDDLVPSNDMLEQQPFSFGVVEALDGVDVKIPGFIVPLEVTTGGKVSEFLLVPYFGACIHYPPPAPNQIVYVTVEEPISLESTWDAIWATGELKTEFSDFGLGAAGYKMVSGTIEPYVF
ncbi:DUF3299 domain-containing protein [Candidatus Foliamicus sp.]